MDITDIVAAPRQVSLRNPATDEKLGIEVTLLPSSHPKVEKVRRTLLNRRLQSRKTVITAEQAESMERELLIAAIDGWTWDSDLTLNGQKPEFTPDNAEKLVRLPWVHEQLKSEVDNTEAFFGDLRKD